MLGFGSCGSCSSRACQLGIPCGSPWRRLAVLNLLQSGFHALLGAGVDDLRAGVVVAELGGVRDRVAHVAQAALHHQVNDQLHFVQALEVGHFWGVAGFDQGVEAVLDQLGQTTAEHNLLAEEVGFGLFLEGGFDDASAGAAKAGAVGQGGLQALPVASWWMATS